MSRSRKNHHNNLMNYAIPIIFAIIIIGLLAQALFWEWNNNPQQDFLFIEPLESDSKIEINYQTNKSGSVIERQELYLNEKIRVDAGIGKITKPESDFEILLKKGAHIRNSSLNPLIFILENSEAWITANTSRIQMELKEFTIIAEPGSIVNAYQTSVWSTVYVLLGTANISKNDLNIPLSSGKKIEMLSSEKLSNSLITDITESDFNQPWFIQNYSKPSEEISSNENIKNIWISSLANSSSTTKVNYIDSILPLDETSITDTKTEVTGKITHPKVSRITVNNTETMIDTTTSTFSAKNIYTGNSVNDIVIKLFDDENKLLSKKVLTLYNLTWNTSSNTNTNSTVFQLSNKDFKIVSPKGDVYTTSESLVRIDGQVPVGKIKKITVNDYELQKFPEGGKNWYYFANQQYGTMSEGVNLYKIQYFDFNDTLVYEHVYTIIKTETQPVISNSVISDENTIQ